VNSTGAWLQVLRAADIYDRDGDGVGIAANSAKVATSNAAYEAANHGMQTFGGWSVTEEYDIDRLWRDACFFQIGPVSNELAKTFIIPFHSGRIHIIYTNKYIWSGLGHHDTDVVQQTALYDGRRCSGTSRVSGLHRWGER